MRKHKKSKKQSKKAKEKKRMKKEKKRLKKMKKLAAKAEAAANKDPLTIPVPVQVQIGKPNSCLQTWQSDDGPEHGPGE